MKRIPLILLVLMAVVAAWQLRSAAPAPVEDQFVVYRTDARRENIRLYWRDEKQMPLRSIQRLKQWLHQRGEQLQFAMNGGMYVQGNSPKGLFIRDGKTLVPLDTARRGAGNFYLQPNGVFYLTNNQVPAVCTTARFPAARNVRYATQSGPMLLIDGHINPVFKAGSANLNVRNGVGILPDNRVVFVLSKQPVSFYDFARYFQRLGCHNALYLDGLVSRAYVPTQNWRQTDGDFGVMIGITSPGNP